MQLFQIDGFKQIDGVNRMPDVREHFKLLRWNNIISDFDYKLPREIFDYLEDATYANNILTITKSNGEVLNINILTTKSALILPGDTKVLFDKADTIGGENQFKYDYINHRIVLTDSNGIYGLNSDFDVTPANLLQYLGNYNLLVNFGSSKVPTATMAHNLGMGYDALANVTIGLNNIAIGRKAAADVANTVSNSIFIGPYAGRLNQDDNRLYIHNVDFTTLEDFVTKSLLYGEFDNGRLFVNNRLSVREEVGIGNFNDTNTPSAGMVRMTPIPDDKVKPQYYDGTTWLDFANGLNYYLNGVDVTPIDAYSNKITFHVLGFGDIEATLPDTHLTVVGSVGNIQYNNGAGDLGASANLSFDSAINLLSLGGSLALSVQTLAAYQGIPGAIVNTGDHIYAKLNSGFVQLDNALTDGEVNHGESVGTAVEIYKGINIVNKNLQFFDLKGGNKIVINEANEFGNIVFDLDYTVSGANLGSIGAGLYTGVSDTVSSTVLNFKRLYSSDNSVVITDQGNYLNLTATSGGVGSGEVNSGQNEGTGEGRIFDEVNLKNGLNLLFRTIKANGNINISTNTASKIVEVSVDPFVNNGSSNGASGIPIYTDYSEISGKRTLKFNTINGTNGISATVVDGVITLSVDETITTPSLSGVVTPIATNTNKTLTWHVSYSPNTRTTNPSDLDIARLNLGSNLIYNPTTNTLDSIGASGDKLSVISNTNIVRKEDGTVNREVSNRNIKFQNESGVFITWDGETILTNGLGWLAFENDFPIASKTKLGVVQAGNNINIDENGVISVDIPDVPDTVDAVLYTVQNLLHNADEDQTTIINGITRGQRRANARANIGAAYVNGSATEAFLAAGVDINQPNPNDPRGLILRDNYIRSEWGHVMLMNNDGNNHISTFSVGNGVAEINLDARGLPGGIGAFNIFMYNANGTRVKVASLKGRYEDGELRADLKIKGNFMFRCTDAQMEA